MLRLLPAALADVGPYLISLSYHHHLIGRVFGSSSVKTLLSFISLSLSFLSSPSSITTCTIFAIMLRTQTRTSSIYSADDPLALALKPPLSESEIERQNRIDAELEAKRISDKIDEEIRQERESKKKANMEVKVSVCDNSRFDTRLVPALLTRTRLVVAEYSTSHFVLRSLSIHPVFVII